jgi:hypothetical protein
VSIHWHFGRLAGIGRNFIICHRMGLSIFSDAWLR